MGSIQEEFPCSLELAWLRCWTCGLSAAVSCDFPHRVFDQVLKYQGCPRLDQTAAFCDLTDFDSCKAKAFRERSDGGTRILMVARDEHDSSADIVGQGVGENLKRQLIEGLYQLSRPEPAPC
jgi:hypothetical protein